MKYIVKLSALTIIAAIIFTGCKSADPCPETPFVGNLGGAFNSDLEEYCPVFLGETIYYTTLPNAKDKEKSDKEEIRFAKYENNEWSQTEKDTLLPLKKIKKAGLPTFARNGKEVFFVGQNEEKKNYSRDIYYSRNINGTWTDPIEVFGVNSSKYESFPAVSPDGAYLVFTSDREGGEGGLDLYISFREDTNRWSYPMNLGNIINTPNDETAPYIDPLDKLYFSSNKTGGEGGFDIYKADIKKPGEIPEILPYPINTTFDEKGMGIFKGKIYLGSNRSGGCGGEDLYAFDICGPAFIEGSISASNKGISLEGNLMIENLSNGEKSIINISKDGKFKTELTPQTEYKMSYQNPCIKDVVGEKVFFVPCSDTSVIKIVSDIKVKAKAPKFDFTRYEIPFFSTGYYMPLTTDNLQNLKQKFSYNLIGKNPSTNYIEYPSDEYNKQIPKVELALKDAAQYIFGLVDNYSDGCNAFAINHIKIKITGYSDPRPINKGAKYIDATVDEYGLKMLQGDEIDNEKLSLLRAYYTAKQIEQNIMDITGSLDYSKLIEWEIIGLGIDDSNKELNEKRRVSIEISVE